MLIYEYKLGATPAQDAALEEAIRITQFIRNKAVRLWMDTRGTSKNDLQCLCADLARQYPFARLLNSQARKDMAASLVGERRTPRIRCGGVSEYTVKSADKTRGKNK